MSVMRSFVVFAELSGSTSSKSCTMSNTKRACRCHSLSRVHFNPYALRQFWFIDARHPNPIRVESNHHSAIKSRKGHGTDGAIIVRPNPTAVVYKVGDEVGWTTMGSPNYTAWAISKTFHKGDTVGEFLP
ncbi:hypothetical protein C4D60_Mb06t05690 [Musa balbisiana]|uniref:Phytocyanin domain-containing protein n=1 Tax=Musa balbisiana TaxID=52838 RepID=A0A4S8IKX6_MUSBA|nr:hypothetical protein C4D60_Mb06t05690 [Musa balbisiana]